ncbi:TNT domain-containing protein [Streptomyces sp. FH025]|uniref:TNT domain-containing protein n=1 Tax=Streptomyces sp. FH025 TaxID=2815937 RepID=UPI001A9DE691|nr:TNT domain-containing protein [Streptomyces sp. FH025]MBO1416401.1 TNT domain-containing protein [Streptomyces sp. FH025]
MRSFRLIALPIAAVLPLTVVATAGTAVAAPASHRALPTDCDSLKPTADPAVYYCGLPELGPTKLPTGEVGKLLTNYHRFGGLEPAQFLSLYRNGTSWIYPGNNGFAESEGKIDMQKQQTVVNKYLDRFGGEGGGYLAPGGTPYAQRAIPTDSLNDAATKYHCYQVTKSFPVQQGHIAAFFNQPGYGIQQWLDPALKPTDFGADSYNVAGLIKHNYLKPITDVSKCVNNKGAV